MSARVSLAAAARELATDVPAALLAPGGAAVVLAAPPAADALAQPLAPRADTLFGPRGACLAGPEGPLYVCDTGHHRVLVWRRRPVTDHEPADLVLGQPGFDREGRNARGPVGAATLNVPTGVAWADGVLAVADAWNHRVLLWLAHPARSGQPADVVVGQAGGADALANRGREEPGADTLNWCYGVALEGGGLYVADTGNRRVLVWDRVPTTSGAPADRVLGQRDFGTRDENAGGAANAMSMRWPHGVALRGGQLCVADAGNNRVLLWREVPRVDGQAADAVLGQGGFGAVDHNQSEYLPRADTLSMPYGATFLRARLVVADTANSRLLGWPAEALETGAPARFLAGQRRFVDKGDNRWSPATRDSLCWPYWVAASGDTLVVADAGNNRLLLWDAAR